MGKTLNEISLLLKNAKHGGHATAETVSDVKVQLIYAFNGMGKTRLSREFKTLFAPESSVSEEDDSSGLDGAKIIYYNAFTEDLFHWDNDLESPKLLIKPNLFTNGLLQLLKEQGEDQKIIGHFQRYTDKRLTPKFSTDFSEVSFSFQRGNDEDSSNVKISKGEESNFVWSVFYSLLELVLNELSLESQLRSVHSFDNLEYVFIDDPVSSLDENHLIELAVDLAQKIKQSKSNLKFIVTTHNPLFFNVLYNEFKKEKFKKYILSKLDDGMFELQPQSSDSPFSYHLYLKAQIEKAIRENQLSKFHFNYLRNILEKTSTFLGHDNWGDLLPKDADGHSAFESRIINISSHSKHSAEEVVGLTPADRSAVENLLQNADVFKLFKPYR